MSDDKSSSLISSVYKGLFVTYTPIAICAYLYHFYKYARILGWQQALTVVCMVSVGLLSVFGFFRFFVLSSSFKSKGLEDFAMGLFCSRKSLVFYWLPIMFCVFQGGRYYSENAPPVRYQLKLATAWDATLPIFAERLQEFVRKVEANSHGQLTIELYPANTAVRAHGDKILVKDLLLAASRRDVDLVHGASYYWRQRVPGSVFFGSIPFGMDRSELVLWTEPGADGRRLWEKIYQPHNVIPFPAGHTGAQMGGWFQKEIKTVNDFKGLRMRIAGLGADTVARLGGIPNSIGQSELLDAMKRHDIDAAEWIGPAHDHAMMLDSIGKFYYEPGWQEPDTMLEMLINKETFSELPQPLQFIIEAAIKELDSRIYDDIEKANREARDLMTRNNVQFRTFPEEVISSLRQASDAAIQKYVSDDKSGITKEISDSYERHRKIREQ